MTYDGQSPIVGTGTVTPAAIDAWFAHKGPGYAAYAPDGLYKPAPAIGNSIVVAAGIVGVNSDLVAAQCLHESAAWQSRIAREKNNPAGLGAENDDPEGKAIAFLTPDMGIRAQVAHLADYAIGRGDWTKYDPRADAMPEHSFGIAKTLTGLDGRWAFPGVGYGARIAALANDLVAFAQTGGPVVDISGFTPPRIVQQWFKPNGKSYMGEDMDMWGVCVHQTGNTSPGAEAQQNVTYMNSAECINRQASWHSTVGLEEVIETIPQTKQAYHASDGDGPGNTHFKAVEHVVCYKVGTPEYKRVMLNGAWYVAKSLIAAGKPATADTLKQHHDFARDGKDCPMQFRDNHQWPEYVAYVQAFHAQLTNAPAPDPSAPITVPPTIPDPWKSPIRPNTWIPRVFVDEINREGFMRAGYVVSEGFAEGDKFVQYFQRARLELNRDGSVTWGLVGEEALAARYPNRRAA